MDSKKIKDLSDPTIQELICTFFIENPNREITKEELAKRLKISIYKIKRELKVLQALGVIRSVYADVPSEYAEILEHVKDFFIKNGYSVFEFNEIVIHLKLSREAADILLEILVDKKFIQKVKFDGANVYRHVPSK